MTTDGFVSLCRMQHLNELTIDMVKLDLVALTKVRIPPLPNMQQLTFKRLHIGDRASTALCRFISHNLPNLDKFHIDDVRP